MIECFDVERSGSGAADVGPVTVGLGVAEKLALVVDGPDDAGVVEMAPALVDVVDHEDVAGMDVALELPDDRLGGVVQGSDVGGDVAGALHDGVALGVAECRGEVP